MTKFLVAAVKNYYYSMEIEANSLHEAVQLASDIEWEDDRWILKKDLTNFNVYGSKEIEINSNSANNGDQNGSKLSEYPEDNK